MPLLLLSIFLQVNIHGIDWNGPIPFTDEDNVVDIDPPPSFLCNQDYQELSQTINPLDRNSQYGIELYMESIQFVSNKIR